jgi:hypothetical protein
MSEEKLSQTVTEAQFAKIRRDSHLIEEEVERLFERLEAKNVCLCCVGQDLIHHGVQLLADTVGEAAIAACRKASGIGEPQEVTCHLKDFPEPDGTEH